MFPLFKKTGGFFVVKNNSVCYNSTKNLEERTMKDE